MEGVSSHQKIILLGRHSPAGKLAAANGCSHISRLSRQRIDTFSHPGRHFSLTQNSVALAKSLLTITSGSKSQRKLSLDQEAVCSAPCPRALRGHFPRWLVSWKHQTDGSSVRMCSSHVFHVDYLRSSFEKILQSACAILLLPVPPLAILWSPLGGLSGSAANCTGGGSGLDIFSLSFFLLCYFSVTSVVHHTAR